MAKRNYARNWVFTRNLSGNEVTFMESLPGKTDFTEDCPFTWMHNEHCAHTIFQLEKAPTTGQLHLQGYIRTDNAMAFNSVKIMIGGNAHLEKAHDTAASILYCQKESTRQQGPWEFGTAANAGKRTDLEQLYKMIKNGKREIDIVDDNPKLARYEKQIKYMKFLLMETVSDRTDSGVEVSVYYGVTGTGKSWSAIKKSGADGNYFKLDCTSVKHSALWFDGYQGQDLLILDDFDGDVCTCAFLKNLLDIYKMRLPIKGGHTWAAWHKVIITSNAHPAKWWYAQEEWQLEALQRRIHNIRHYTMKGIYELVNWKGESQSDFINEIE